MHKKQAKLKAAVVALLGAVVLYASAGNEGSQQLARQLAAIPEGGKTIDDKLLSLSAKIHSDGPADIWLINQPKCGTGYLERVITTSPSLNCKPYDDTEGTKFVDCGNNKLYFRTHSVETATTVKTLFDLGRSRNAAKVDQCVAITALRNPLQSIPSMFFQSWSICEGDSAHSRSCNQRLCDGSLPVGDVVTMYERYLASSMPARQVQTTANMIKAFSGEDVDLYEAFSMLAEKGVAFFENTNMDSPWAGCELIFLQIDHDDDGGNVDNTMGVLFPGELKSFLSFSRSHHCPNAAESIEAIYNYELTDQHLDRFAKTNPEMREVFRYYGAPPS